MNASQLLRIMFMKMFNENRIVYIMIILMGNKRQKVCTIEAQTKALLYPG